jgi:hypothetical protein
MKTTAIIGVIILALLSAIGIACGTGIIPHGNNGPLADLWIRLTLTDPIYIIIVALAVASGWIVAELRSSKASLRIVCGFATIALFGLFHVLVSGRLRVEIELHQFALHGIERHIETDALGEVSRAIRIYNQEYESTGDSFTATQALLDELHRGTN